MKQYVVYVSGCDDSTSALVELTDEQAEGVRIVAAATDARSTYVCQPVIVFTTREDAESYHLKSALDVTA